MSGLGGFSPGVPLNQAPLTEAPSFQGDAQRCVLAVAAELGLNPNGVTQGEIMAALAVLRERALGREEPEVADVDPSKPLPTEVSRG